CSATTAAFSSRCSDGSACCQSHPPHPPGTASGHGGCTRRSSGCRMSTASARQYDLCRSSVTSTTTRSPGSACRTNTTRPSWRATQWPPCATGPTSTSNRLPVQSSCSVIGRVRSAALLRRCFPVAGPQVGFDLRLGAPLGGDRLRQPLVGPANGPHDHQQRQREQ